MYMFPLIHAFGEESRNILDYLHQYNIAEVLSCKDIRTRAYRL